MDASPHVLRGFSWLDCIAVPAFFVLEVAMQNHALGSLAVFLFVQATMGNAIDPIFMTGIVAICAIVVFSLTIISVVIFSEGNAVTAKAALDTLVKLWRAIWR